MFAQAGIPGIPGGGGGKNPGIPPAQPHLPLPGPPGPPLQRPLPRPPPPLNHAPLAKGSSGWLAPSWSSPPAAAAEADLAALLLLILSCILFTLEKESLFEDWKDESAFLGKFFSTLNMWKRDGQQLTC